MNLPRNGALHKCLAAITLKKRGVIKGPVVSAQMLIKGRCAYMSLFLKSPIGPVDPNYLLIFMLCIKAFFDVVELSVRLQHRTFPLFQHVRVQPQAKPLRGQRLHRYR